MQAIRREAFEFLLNNGFDQKVNNNRRGQDMEFSAALRYTPYHCGENKDTYLTHYFGEERFSRESLKYLRTQAGHAMFDLAPYRYVYRSKYTSYYYFTFRTLLSLILAIFRTNKTYLIKEKLTLLKNLFLRKKDYQDLEAVIRNAKWNTIED